MARTALEIVKDALRIRHKALDAEIERLISTARADIIRVGVDAILAQSDDDLVIQAIVTYCLLNMSSDPELMDKYKRAYEIQIDGLRRMSGNEGE
ncbi:MAG: hypothetical protein SPL71_05230 [Oribacterium sp.]|nr:hypothetical protein [Oribacterium sp.]